MRSKNDIINTIKLLLYKEKPTLFEYLDFENDKIYLNQLLFAYFNSKNEGLFSSNILIEILQGYFIDKKQLFIKESFNKDGIAYLPNLGYFDETGKLVDDLFEIDKFEIIKHCHPILEKYFIEFYKGKVINSKPTHRSVWKENSEDLEKAILIIKKYLPKFYMNLVYANKRIYIHDNPKILNFTSIETLGMLYFYVIGKQNLIYFIEELVHQGSHNFLYYIVHKRKDYFKIDVDNLLMRDYTRQAWDYRNIYGAFHGLYTVKKRVECFDILLTKKIFSGREKHELLGRLADMFPRFQTGLELLNLDEVYTEKGKKFYFELTQKCESILKKYKNLTKEFDLSHRDLDFRYNEFCLTNSFEDFQKKDLEGYYNF